MSNAIILFVSLFVTWVVLSGFFGAFFLTLGLISCLIAVVVAKLMSRQSGESRAAAPMLLRLPSYLAWLEWEVIKSSVDVALKMWQLEPDISPTMAWVSTTQKDDVGLAVLANSITLTPGTVSVVVRGDLIQVHALNKEGIDALHAGEMDKKVLAAVGQAAR